MRDESRRGDDPDVRRVPASELEGVEPAEGEIRIPIVEEELVVEKRAVVREVLVIRKRVVTETRQVEADLKRERIQVTQELETEDAEAAGQA